MIAWPCGPGLVADAGRVRTRLGECLLVLGLGGVEPLLGLATPPRSASGSSPAASVMALLTGGTT